MLKELLKSKMEKIKPEKMSDMPMEMSHYPSVHLSSKDLPEIKEWEVGEEYYLVMKVKQTSKNEHVDDEMSHAGFDILEIGALDDEMEDDEEEKLKKKYVS